MASATTFLFFGMQLRMITIKEALERILSYVDRLPAEEKHPIDALGQVLDEDVPSRIRHSAAGQHGDGRLRRALRTQREQQRKNQDNWK